MPRGSLDKVSPTFIQQADAVLAQANPVSTTVYTVLTTRQHARIHSVLASVTGANATPLTVTVTIDGIAKIYTLNPGVDGTAYYIGLDATSAANAQDLDNSLGVPQVFIPVEDEGQSVGITAVCTHAGAITSLDVRVKWSQKVRS